MCRECNLRRYQSPNFFYGFAPERSVDFQESGVMMETVLGNHIIQLMIFPSPVVLIFFYLSVYSVRSLLM